jgi:uncharacterized membrane protein YjjP (DUF1212 family)
MTIRQERQAAQKAKIAAMPLSKRIAYVVWTTVAAAASATLVISLLSGGFDLGLVLAPVIGVMIVVVYQYLIAPARQNRDDEPR